MGVITKRELKALLETPPEIPKGLEEHIGIKVKEEKAEKKPETKPRVLKIKAKEKVKQEQAVEKELEETDTKIRAIDKSFDKRDTEIASKITGLERVKDLLEEKEKLLTEKETELRGKEKQLTENTKELSRDVYQWNKKKTVIEQEVTELEKRRQMILNLEKDWQIKKRGVEEEKKALAQKEPEMHMKISEVENYKKELEIKEAEINAKLKEMEENRTILIAEEEKVKKRLMELKEKNDLFNDNMIKLIEVKKQTEIDMAQKLKEMQQARAEWQALLEIFKDDVKYVKELEGKIISPSVIKELQDDAQLIVKKEKEIVKEVERLEQDRELLERRQNEILRKVEQLESLEKDLRVREAKIARAKELKENLALFEKGAAEAKKKYDEEQQKLNKLIEEGNAKLGYLKSRELEITRRETEVKLKEQWIIDKENELKREREIMEKEGVHKFVERQRGERVMYHEGEAIPKNADLEILLKQARELIRAGRLEEAKRTINQIQVLYSRLRNEDEEKRKINYEIIELQTDIKLAALQ